MQFAFHGATGRVRAVCPPVIPPGVRVATLGPDSRPISPWLMFLEWFGMVAPVAIPVVSAVVLCMNVGHVRYPWFCFGGVSLALVFGILPAGTQAALRFGARSSDWAPDPADSRRYRALLGAQVVAAFIHSIAVICILSLMIGLTANNNMPRFFLVSFPLQAVLLIFVFRVRAWLVRHTAEESMDPMPDACWKWGWYYSNPSDPAVVVPLRSGPGCSFNFAVFSSRNRVAGDGGDGE
jgi:hypothetical protein